MPTFQRCPKEVNDMANEIMCQFELHQSLLDAKIKIDYVFAFGDVDDNGNRTGNAPA